jgi:5-(carboxyamino)imidazole ribonucleotide synthase
MIHATAQTSTSLNSNPKSASGRPSVGIIGGGQLARMLAQSATSLGCDIRVVESDPDCPAASVSAVLIEGSTSDLETLRKLAAQSDVVTLENEFIDSRLLAALEAEGHIVRPTSATMEKVQDKLVQKQALEAAGLPVPAFRAVNSQADVAVAAESLGWPLVLKKRRNGYDGKGNATVRSADEIFDAWAKLDGETCDLYVEQFCPFTAELAIIITRSAAGESVAYPLVTTVQKDHICHVVSVPAEVGPDLAVQAEAMARQAITAMGGIGSFGVEMFLLADGRVLINELAPRVHNSGHYTIEGTICSQFENHIRAVMGWPLGSTELRAPAVVMVNLLGHGEGQGSPTGLVAALSFPGAHLHLYGKALSKRGRKMGHITALGATVAEALATARSAADSLQFGTPS